MTELGIDSLAIVEFADEVDKLFKKQFLTNDLSNMSLQALIDACGEGSNDGVSVASSQVENASEGSADTPVGDESYQVIGKSETIVVKHIGGVTVEVDLHAPKT
ncbi:hypothetical protein LZ30DRAFT_787565 [Colletotrichum cereale]|nr:hypothetical protein LZ30DRAFT_787565 [Colletotrichum cereale]